MNLTYWFPLSIYTLTDPRTGRVRYVGCTSQVKERVRRHMAPSAKAPAIRRAWFDELKALGLKPVCDVLESGRHITFADERKWIAYYLACGADLVNVVGTPAYKRHAPKSEQLMVRVRAARARRDASRMATGELL